jgi:hypothetical protein
MRGSGAEVCVLAEYFPVLLFLWFPPESASR